MKHVNDLDDPIDPATLCSICGGAGDPGVGVTCPRCGGSGFEPPEAMDPARCDWCGKILPGLPPGTTGRCIPCVKAASRRFNRLKRGMADRSEMRKR